MRQICDRHGALLGIDECHASGFVGATGRGTHEFRGLLDSSVAGAPARARVDIITGTLGKALGGAAGGFTAARREVVELLRQRSRPYLFSNTLPPAIVGGAIAALDLIEASTALRDRVEANTVWFRDAMTQAGFALKPGQHPIIPIMVGDAVLAQRLSARLFELGVYAVGFFFPVVPQGQARIRVQISAVHQREHLERAVAAFKQAAGELGLLRP
jgi:glycine C-acetyltransferase